MLMLGKARRSCAAQVEGLVIVTADRTVQQYDVALLDASR
jgi:hypothetical protein